MAIRKFGTEPANVETRAEDNDPETLGAVKAEAVFNSSPVAADVDEFLARPETGKVRDRSRRV